jgi:hypothetical protein
MFGEHLPDGARRAGQPQPLGQQVLLAVEVVENRLGAGRALQVFGWMVANFQNPVDDGLIQWGWEVVTGRRTIPQDRFITGRSGAQALDPALDPIAWASDLVSVLLVRPVGMRQEQAAEMSTISNQVLFHASSLQTRGGVLTWSLHQGTSGGDLGKPGVQRTALPQEG